MMTACTLNDQRLFGGSDIHITVGPWTHDSQRHSVAGLDGVVHANLGRRGRTITQTGTLHADTVRMLYEAIERIETFTDGRSCVLRTPDHTCYENLSMDRFEITGPVRRGTPVRCDYEITYTQRHE